MKYNLNQGWQLISLNETHPFQSEIDLPCQIHDALIREGIIINPNITGINHDRWVGESGFIYQRDFVEEEPEGKWSLQLSGVDTFADIYLNGSLVGTHASAFMPCKLEGLSLEKENRLQVCFYPPGEVMAGVSLPDTYAGYVSEWSAVRAFRSGLHDYCGPIPDMVRMGIAGSVLLWRSDKAHLDELMVDAKLDESFAYGTVQVTVQVPFGEDSQLRIRLEDSEKKICAKALGTAGEPIQLICPEPKLWWPRSHGNPDTYQLCVELWQDDICIDNTRRTIGFRMLSCDSDFNMKINGKPLRLWGANLAHPNTVTGCYDQLRVHHLLDLAELGNFNCLRVWGEGELLDDDFYEQCDQRGLLIWHDFYLCNALYSEEKEFLELCRQEAIWLVKRLRHHPALLLWCGGNEMLLNRDYNHPEAYCWGEKIFMSVYPEVCRDLDPDRYYHPCSPYGGDFSNDPRTGDTHGYTHLWEVPGARYPIFASENCRVSAPALRTMRRMMTDEELWPEGFCGLITKDAPLIWPATWSAHNTNEGYKKAGPIERFYDADDAPSLIYRLGAAHGLYIKRDVERFRRGRPDWESDGSRHTHGHLLWRFNNNCNIISYGVVDYFGEPMMAYYALKNSYAPLLASFSMEDTIGIWLTNDTPQEVKGTVVVKRYSLSQACYTASLAFPFDLSPDISKRLGGLEAFGQFPRDEVLIATIFDEKGNDLGQTVDYVDMERHLRFPQDAKVEIKVTDGKLRLSCNQFARCVELLGNADDNEFGWYFSDNYFDIIPGETKVVEVFGYHQAGTITAKPYYSNNCTEIAYIR